MSKKAQSNLLLIITAFIWGSAFVAQRSGMSHIGPLTFMAFRNFTAVLFLLLVLLVKHLLKKKNNLSDEMQTRKRPTKKMMAMAGLSCGLMLFSGSTLQQYGLVTVSAGKTGFITALYLVLVPVFGFFIGKKPRLIHVICTPIALTGLWFLTMTGSGSDLSIGRGEILVFLCAIAFACQILCVDYFVQYVDGLHISLMQLTVCFVLGTVGMLLFEEPNMHAVWACMFSILYAGVLSSGVAFTFQILAQKHTDPTVACLIMSLESVFSVISGWLVLNEHLAPKELLGCLIVFVAVVLSQLPSKQEWLEQHPPKAKQ